MTKENFGPFVVTYPSYNGELAGTECVLMVNGKELDWLPESGEEFYLTEEDGIILGEENTLKIYYEGKTNFAGTFERYTPERDVRYFEAICDICLEDGLYCYSYFLTPEDEPIFCDFKTDTVYMTTPRNTWTVVKPRQADCDHAFDYDNYENFTPVEFRIDEKENQDIIVVDVDYDELEQEDKITFWAGRKLIIDIDKQDNASTPNKLEGIEFNATVLDTNGTYIKGENGEKLYNNVQLTTDKNGKITLTVIALSKEVNLKITETDNNYYINNGDMYFNFEWDDSRGWRGTIDSRSANDVKKNVELKKQTNDRFTFDLNITNIAKIQKLQLLKVNTSVDNWEVIEGVEFQIQLENATYEDGSSTQIKTTDKEGIIDLGLLKVIDPNEDIIVILKETGVPRDDLNFHGIYETGEVRVIFKHREEGCTVVNWYGDANIVEAKYYVEENVVSIGVKNEVTLSLSGKVWLDGQTGIKPVQEPNSIQDRNEPGIENILVVAKRYSDDKIIAETYTDKNGEYEFIDLSASVNKDNKDYMYYIEFTYDGINFITVKRNVGKNTTIDSDVTEIDRDDFNDKFTTIAKDAAYNSAGRKTATLEYEHNGTKATLITTDRAGDVLDDFAMTATTLKETYQGNTENIDMGLVRKNVDLAAVTDIYTATIRVNGIEKTYNYNDISNLNKNENGTPIISDLQNTEVKYSLYLYNSDYNYRIGDYKGLAESKVYGMNPSQNENMGKTTDDELSAEITYQILLNNQSATDVTLNQIAYYYDTHYTLEGVTPEIVTINGKDYNKVIFNINKEFTDSDNQMVGELTFSINKDTSGNLYTGEMQNWVEIISYSTDTSCVDVDSAPDNIEEPYENEDDTDDAAGLVVQINKVQREVSGYIFEDKKTQTNTSGKYTYVTGNGLKDNGETPINDIIIQLIEQKQVVVGDDIINLEYIWQETTSGSTLVKCINPDGTRGEYTVTNEDGGYIFKNFIPGNYIVRFIYGDGTYFDTAINGRAATDTAKGNILKYNGQDYKSTIDIGYNEGKFENIAYAANASMARDNEARRVAEIGYARSATSDEALKINKDNLANTWMCAETSKIYVDVSKDGTAQNAAHGDNVEIFERTANFGLVERPRATLKLEKHLTSLIIDGGTLVNATTTLEEYDKARNGIDVELENNLGQRKVTTSTATNKDKNNRGTWLVEVEAEKLSGKNLDIVYTYRVTNIGEMEYTGIGLANEISDWVTLENEIKNKMCEPGFVPGQYVGTVYYTGKPTNIGTENVESKIPFQVEDYESTSNGLKLNSTGSDFAIVTQKVNKKIWDYDSTGTGVTNTAEENVNVLQSVKHYNLNSGESITLTQSARKENLNSTNGLKEFRYRSYAAQLIYPTTGSITSTAGTLAKGMILSNLATIQSYVKGTDIATGGVAISEIVPEQDEFIAETVEITLPTGGDKSSPVMLIISITAGLVIIAAGVILVKKFIIK